jgi:hypothetical protein
MACSGAWSGGTAFVTFEDVKVPVENLIGKENDGFKSIFILSPSPTSSLSLSLPHPFCLIVGRHYAQFQSREVEFSYSGK